MMSGPPVSANERITNIEMDRARQEYASNGYFILRNVVSAERLVDLHKSLAEEFANASGNGKLFSGGGLVSGHLNCFPGAGTRFVYEALVQRGIIDFIKELHPKSVRMPNVGCNFNLPG